MASSTLTTSAYFAWMSKRFASWGAWARSPTQSRGTIVGQPYWSRSIAVARTQPEVVAPHTDHGQVSFPLPDTVRDTVGVLVEALLQQRQEARERKDWAAADAVRDQLKSAGVDIEDTPAGPRWTLAGS